MIILYVVLGLLAALAVPVLIGMAINFVQGLNPANQHRPNIQNGDPRCAICEKFLNNRVHDNYRIEQKQRREIEKLEEWHDNFRLSYPEFEDQVRNEMFPELAPQVKDPCEGCPPDPMFHPEKMKPDYTYPRDVFHW